ncbi:G patch domain-containing protein [Plasmodiophora brassicae]
MASSLKTEPAAFLGTPLTGRPRATASSAGESGRPSQPSDRYKQELQSGLVSDYRGGQRLHGAFHGGWSAGYFNTVGSLAGFTPSTFVSSRRADVATQRPSQPSRPEDFMDDEDLAEQVALRPQTQFASSTTTAPATSGPVPHIDVVVRTIGVMLMQRMGWSRSNPTIGRPRAALRSFNVEPPPTGVAPPKNDAYGLGYTPEPTQHRLSSLLAGDQYDAAITDEYDDVAAASSSPPRSDAPRAAVPGFVKAMQGTPPDLTGTATLSSRIVVPDDYRADAVQLPEQVTIAPRLERYRAVLLTPRQRAIALGDAAAAVEPEARPASVFELISADDRARLSASLSSMFRVGETLRVGADASAPVVVHYPDDPAKQARFVQYMKQGAGGAGDATQATWRSALEADEFARLATDAAVKREPGASPDQGPVAVAPHDASSAARMRMFGALTRESDAWAPPRLLCKRFGVPDPFQGRAVPEPTIVDRDARFRALLATLHPSLVAPRATTIAPTPVRPDDGDADDRGPEPRPERPPVDLFKAIFSDSEEDDDDDQEQDEVVVVPEQAQDDEALPEASSGARRAVVGPVLPASALTEPSGVVAAADRGPSTAGASPSPADRVSPVVHVAERVPVVPDASVDRHRDREASGSRPRQHRSRERSAVSDEERRRHRSSSAESSSHRRHKSKRKKHRSSASRRSHRTAEEEEERRIRHLARKLKKARRAGEHGEQR